MQQTMKVLYDYYTTSQVYMLYLYVTAMIYE